MHQARDADLSPFGATPCPNFGPPWLPVALAILYIFALYFGL